VDFGPGDTLTLKFADDAVVRIEGRKSHAAPQPDPAAPGHEISEAPTRKD